MAYWHHVRESIVGKTTEFIKKAVCRSLAFHGVDIEVIQYIEGEDCSWTGYSGREET